LWMDKNTLMLTTTTSVVVLSRVASVVSGEG
jgi:hypothetical protein